MSLDDKFDQKIIRKHAEMVAEYWGDKADDEENDSVMRKLRKRESEAWSAYPWV